MLERGWADGQGDGRPASRCATNWRRPPASACLCRPQVLANELAMMMRWPELMGFEDPRVGNARIIAQVVLEQLGVPADGPAAAVGVVAGGSDQAVAVGQGHGRAVAGDGPRHCFQCPGGDGRGADRRGGGLLAGSRRAVSTGTGVSVAGRMPALRVRRTAGGPGALHRSGRARAEAAARGRGMIGDGRDAGPLGVGGGRPRTGRRGWFRLLDFQYIPNLPCGSGVQQQGVLPSHLREKMR